MWEDILAGYRPLPEWFEKLRSDADALWEACELWVDAATEVGHGMEAGAAIVDFDSFRALTLTIAAVCDTGEVRSDPAPLLETLSAYSAFMAAETDGSRQECFDRYLKAYQQTPQAINRLTWGHLFLEGKDPAEKKSKPRGKTVDIIRLIQRGRTNDQICEEIDTTPGNCNVVRNRLKNNEYEV